MQIPVQSTFMHYTWQCSTENSSTIWGLCIPVAGLLNGRAALLWHGKAGIYIEYLLFTVFMQEESCTVILTLNYFTWSSHPELLLLIFFSLLLLHVHIIFLECSYVSLLAVLSLHGRYIYWHTAKLYDQNLDMPPNMPKQDNAREANCHFWICSM